MKRQYQRRRQLKQQQQQRTIVSSLFWTFVLFVLQYNPSHTNHLTVHAFTIINFGIGAILFQPKGIITRTAQGEVTALLEASDFFVDAFWTNKVGGGSKQLTDKQRRTLSSLQFTEFRKRYAGISRGKAELIICQLPSKGKNASSSSSSSSSTTKTTISRSTFTPSFQKQIITEDELIGCAGIEVSPIPEKELKGPIINYAPLMSNLAVSKKYRRKGIGEKLVEEAERVAKYEWGYNDCYLYVEERNKAAIRLYQKLGYRKIWIDNDARTLLPKNDKLQDAPTKIVCMRKRLDLGFWSRFWPF